jgi:sugar lactone lactonase YvrE
MRRARLTRSCRLRCCACVLLSLSAAWASGTAAWEMNTYQDFARGRFQGVSLSRDGRLSLAPKSDTIFSSDQPVVWSAVQAADGTIYAATGHRGRVYRIDKAGAASLLWSADQPEIFSIAIDPNGILYAGTSPDGKVYRIQNGKATEYFNPKAKYIWALVTAPDGTLYVGTGDQGKIFRVDPSGKADLYYDTGQSHITSLALDQNGRVLAGTEPNGILYRVSAKDKAFVLYDASLPEIRAIVPAPDGSIYAAALGGSVAKRTQTAAQSQAAAAAAAVSAPATTITVTADAQAGDIKPPSDTKQQAAQQPNAAATPQVTTQFAPVMDMAGVEKSAIYRINPDNTVETLWTSKDENVYDLAAVKDQLLLATDASGRIYRLSPDRKLTLLLQTNEGEATRLLSSAHGILAATGNMGRIYRLGTAPGNAGSYEAPVHDAGTPSRWGSLSWRGDLPGNSSLVFRTRSGNSARPDKTWSEWSEPMTNPAGAPVSSPNARYIQWKVQFASAAGSGPVLNNVTVAYLPQNTPPVLRAINVTTTMTPAAQQAKPAAQNATAPYTVTVTDTGDASASSAAGTPTQTLTRAGTQQITVSWQAEDPDGDRLVYNLYFRGEGESQWKVVRANLHETSLTFDGDVFADGKYFFRVLASDREVNPPASAREADMVSAPVLIDNTPPLITPGQPRRSGTRIQLDFEAADAASPLRRCEYSLDAGPWSPLDSTDGVVDSLREKFVLQMDNVPEGEHVLVLRVVDSANNAGLAKVILH